MNDRSNTLPTGLRQPLKAASGMLLMLCWLSFAGCGSTPRVVAVGAPTVQCKTDCVSVSQGFIQEHGDLLEETIRLKAKLDACYTKPK